ncbi:hypothetical protein ACOSQ4_003693 [Xanthoceras sorbifolium]
MTTDMSVSRHLLKEPPKTLMLARSSDGIFVLNASIMTSRGNLLVVLCLGICMLALGIFKENAGYNFGERTVQIYAVYSKENP